MSTTEWLLLALVIIIPAIVATGVTLWTLEQVLQRNKKYRRDKDAAKLKGTESSKNPDDGGSQQSELVQGAGPRQPVRK